MIEKILVHCHDNPSVPFTAVAQGMLSNLNINPVLAFTLFKNPLSPKPVLKLLGFKKTLIFKLAIN